MVNIALVLMNAVKFSRLNGHNNIHFDIGSYECRVGWASNENPMMMFRNLIAKPRKEKVKKDGELPLIQPTQIGNDIVNIEAMRYQLRTQVCFYG